MEHRKARIMPLPTQNSENGHGLSLSLLLIFFAFILAACPVRAVASDWIQEDKESLQQNYEESSGHQPTAVISSQSTRSWPQEKGTEQTPAQNSTCLIRYAEEAEARESWVQGEADLHLMGLEKWLGS